MDRSDYTDCAMGDWYTIGLWAGIGVALGIFFTGAFGSLRRWGLVAAVFLAASAAVAAGLALFEWDEAVGGAIGAVAGAIGAALVVGGALRRGGTRLGTAVLVAGGALALATLAFVPALGYVEVAAVPALALRLRRRAPERYAGLRSLARD